LATGVVALVAYANLIPRFGSLGAAWSVATAYAFHCILTHAVAQQVFHVNYEFKRLFGLVIATVGAWLFSRSYHDNDHRFVYDLATMLAWMLVVWLFASTTEKKLAIAALPTLNGLRMRKTRFHVGTDGETTK
jgi:Na+-transporting NADH:ubiquinone oxidoreductase subunit NqrE